MSELVIVNDAVGMRGAWVASVQWALRDLLGQASTAVGVSSGAHNLVSLFSEHHSHYMWTNVLTSRQIYDAWLFLRFRRPANTRYLVDHHLTNVDLDRVFDPTRKLYIGVFNVTTGKSEYYLTNRQNIDELLLATIAYPFFAPLVRLSNGDLYADGGCADPSPLSFTIDQLAAKKILVFGGYPEPHRMTNPGWIQSLAAFPYLWAKAARFALRHRAEAYVRDRWRAGNPAPGIRIMSVMPPNLLALKNFSRDPKSARLTWNDGERYAETIRSEVEKFIQA